MGRMYYFAYLSHNIKYLLVPLLTFIVGFLLDSSGEVQIDSFF